jgi:anti-sigma factor RsiW
MENNLDRAAIDAQLAAGEEMSDYVAHLQMHMALQARNLVPTLTETVDSRELFLQQTQAHFEKLASRQVC